MTNCPDCGGNHEAQEYYARAAEAVVAASTADRAELNARARETLEGTKAQWPDVSTDDLVGFLQSQAMLIEVFSRMSVLKLADALDATFVNCTLAAASLAGAYDLTDDETPKRDVEEILTEAQASRQEYRADDDLSFPGNYL